MLAYSAESQGQSVTLTCSDGRVITTSKWGDIAGFLLQPTDMGVVFNIDTFVDAIIPSLPKQLSDKVKRGGRIFTHDKRKLYYQPSRLFGINYINFYGLSRYTHSKSLTVSELLELANKVIKAFETFGVKVEKLTSPIAVYSGVLDNLDYPRACDLPDSAFPMLEKCSMVMSREWRDVYQLGHWDKNEISDYDLTAAYPSIVAKLPDIRRAKFFTSKTMPSDYSWGILTGRLNVAKPVSPFICEEKNCYGIGEWSDIITTDELWLAKKYEIAEFDLKEGEFFLLPKIYGYPFKSVMERLYERRNTNNELVSDIAKGISVGLVGKLAERHENKLGDNFNSIYAKMATSRCIIKVASFIYHNHLENDLVSVLVDGFLATKHLPLTNKKAMGMWRINEALPALVLSLEYQWQGSKRPGYVNYEEIVEQIRRKPNSPCYGDVDFNLLNYNRQFVSLPKTGRELMSKRYSSTPLSVLA